MADLTLKKGIFTMSDKKTALVIRAHSADFVWRAGGAIALHQAKGYEVTVVCLSYGERGETAKLWKQEGMTPEKVKTERRKEAENAAAKARAASPFLESGKPSTTVACELDVPGIPMRTDGNVSDVAVTD